VLLYGCAQKRGPAQRPAAKAESRRRPPSTARRIELLFLGHDSRHHFSEKYFPMLSLPLFQKGINLTYTSDPNALNTENLSHYDGVVIYANHNTITPAQEAALKTFVESGKALIPLHAASFCFQNSDWYVKAVGGQFSSHKYGTFTAAGREGRSPGNAGLENL
jgi:type 1 glutamine amidotransferase